MTRYRNLSGASNVHSYEILHNGIYVQFNDGSLYLFNTSSTSYHNIEQMKRLATAGSGLNSFIKTTVKKGYASKSR